MHKFRAIILQRDRGAAIANLHEAGVVQLREVSSADVGRRAIGDELFRISALIGELRDYQCFLDLSRFMKSPAAVEEVSHEKVLRSAEKIVKKLGPRVSAFKGKFSEIERKKQDLLEKLRALEGLRDVEIPLKYLRSTDEIFVTVGRVSIEKLQDFLSSAEESLERKIFARAFGAADKRVVVCACRKKDQHKILPLIYRFDVEIIEIPPFDEPAAIAIKSLGLMLEELDMEESSLKGEIRKLAKKVAKDVNCTLELLEVQRERLECGKIFGYTDMTLVMEGWVPAKEFARLEKIFAEATNGRFILRVYDPEEVEIEKIPVELENPIVAEDFEYVTEMYGLPKYNEVDPTPFLSITFPLFFAICLGDAGYGIILGLLMASNVLFFKDFPKKLKRLMITCSVFTVFAGFMMGGWFGDLLSGIHPIFKAHWVSPLVGVGPIWLLKLSLFIGVLHLILAFGFAGALKDFYNRDWKGLIFKKIAYVLLTVGFFGLVFCLLGLSLESFGINYVFPKMGMFQAFNPFVPSSFIVSFFRFSFYIGLALGMVGAVLTGGKVSEKIGGPINVVYSIVSLTADVVSYSRLMALGMASGVIAFLINYIIKFTYESLFPQQLTVFSAIFAGFLLMGLAAAFVVGHAFNMFISTLGGFIHTTRLHFAEFFGKFYESGGEKFTPFKVKRRFTKIKRGGHRW
jgi:V/A-type H+-transporting ATPase subunit I